MAKTVFYRQCFLKRGRWTQTAWLPERFAKAGGYVRLHDSDGWNVVSAGDERRKMEDIHSQQYKKHRKETDI